MRKSATDESLEIDPKNVCRAGAQKISIFENRPKHPHSKLGNFLFATGLLRLFPLVLISVAAVGLVGLRRLR